MSGAKGERQLRHLSEWIEHEPKEKWALLFDEGGARYGLMTTNLAEVYNWVLRGVRSLPLLVVAESTDLQFRFHIFLVSPNKRL